MTWCCGDRVAPAAASEAQSFRAGFTLVELLVVMAIIAVLISLLAPAISRARRQALNLKCLSNVRQVGAAILLYEIDHKRFPMHIHEVVPYSWAENLRFVPFADTRDQYTKYVNVDHFACPFLEPLKYSTCTADRIAADYIIAAGYFADGNAGVYDANRRWTRSADRWTYNGYHLTALAGDRWWRHPFYSPPWNTTINHAAGPGFLEFHADEGPGGIALSEIYGYTPADVRAKFTANFVFTDGSAETFGPNNSTPLIDIPDRHVFVGGAYLFPRR